MKLPSPIACPNRRCSGYSFLEMMVIVSVIGVVASLALTVTASAVERTANQKLRSDVLTLNVAVKVYQANGGDISTALDAQDILNRLKSRLSLGDAARFAGLTSSMIDVRVDADYQTAGEAMTNQLRAAWDPSKGRFVLGDAGGAGIKRFYFDDDAAGSDFETDSRSGFRYALEDDWIWDYEERPKLAPTEVTTVDIYFRDDNGNGVPPSTSPYEEIPEDEDPTEDPGPLPDPDAPTPLNPPLFTPEGGQYQFNQFPLEVTLDDPNEPNTAVLRYAINEGSFRTYASPFTVEGDDIVRAYSASTNTQEYLSSATVSATYEQLPECYDGCNKGHFKKGGNNGHGNNIDGVDVSNPGKAPFDDASGDFDDEKSTAVVGYEEVNDVGIFTMGEPYNGNSPNTLKYKGTQFIQVEPEEMFEVGTLEYFNGTVYSGTQADVVTMELQVSLTTPDQAETLQVPLGFDNTMNTSDAWESADSVVIRYRTIPLAQTLNDKNYFLVVEFGQAADSNGKSDKGKLKVLENSTTSVPVYGYFTTTPPGE